MDATTASETIGIIIEVSYWTAHYVLSLAVEILGDDRRSSNCLRGFQSLLTMSDFEYKCNLRNAYAEFISKLIQY